MDELDTDATGLAELEQAWAELEADPAVRVIVNTGEMNVMAAEMGVGLAYTAAPAVQEQVAAGVLEPVLEEFCAGTPGLFLYYPSRAQALPKLRAFIQFVHDTLRPGTTAYIGARR